jgi:hypothetical protein
VVFNFARTYLLSTSTRAVGYQPAQGILFPWP